MSEYQFSQSIDLGSDGWLLPDGRFLKTSNDDHDKAAEWLLRTDEAMQSLERDPEIVPLRHNYRGLPSREKIKMLGVIPVRGTIVRSDRALNMTNSQLEMLKNAGIRVIDSMDGNKEFNLSDISDHVHMIVNRLNRVGVVRKLHQRVRAVRDKKEEREYSDYFRERTLSDLDKFVKSPLTTVIHGNYFSNDNDYKELMQRIFDVLGSNSSSEMKIDVGRDSYRYRAVEIGEDRLWVEWNQYFHDGHSGGVSGDINDYLSIFVEDPVTIEGKISNLLSNKSKHYQSAPKIDLSGDASGYFRDLMNRVITF